ncbi:MAG TPA: DNA polymerase III subunit gamma/tau, partial [Bacteroidales bacterium]|nr:DNA polymerase III subunit gamma/tau [Bacteroidales bacterium]
NSVDDIRALIDQVRIPPQTGKFKIYIIDEVHMLSQQAFNAFLKTLEEPPSYAKFILATTEKHKIIPTVLSRCQIFDFKRISVDDIVKLLIFVAMKESVSYDADALHIIAQKSDGALRDALSMFDQLVSSANKNLTYHHVIGNLNVLDYDYYFRITQQILENRMPEALLILDDILANGFDGQHFIVGLAEHLRNLLVGKDEITIQLLEAQEIVKQRYRQQSAVCSAQFLLHAIDTANKCDLDYRLSNNKRLHVELAILKIGAQLYSPDTGTTAIPKSMSEAKPGPGSVVTSVYTQSSVKKSEVNMASEPAPGYQSGPVSEKVAEPPGPLPQTTPRELKIAALPGSFTTRISDDDTIEEDKSNPDQHQAESAENQESRFEPLQQFTQKELESAWHAFASQVAKDIPNLFATLTQSVPIIEDTQSFKITYKVHSKVQEREFADYKTELLDFLRSNLNNQQITIQTQIEESQFEGRPYLPADKFNKMAEKNPNLIQFKEKLNLEIDF